MEKCPNCQHIGKHIYELEEYVCINKCIDNLNILTFSGIEEQMVKPPEFKACPNCDEVYEMISNKDYTELYDISEEKLIETEANLCHCGTSIKKMKSPNPLKNDMKEEYDCITDLKV